MNSPRSLEALTVYTASPLEPRRGSQEGLYRNIVGIDMGSRALYLESFKPGNETAIGVTHGLPQQEVLNLPPEMVKHLREYYKTYQVGNPSSINYSCHNLAAALYGTNLTPQEAQQAANEFIETAEPQTTQRRLNPGEKGAYGTKRKDGSGSALHSVIGLGRDRDEVLQADGQGGMISIVPYDVNHKFFGVGSIEFFAKPENRTASRFSVRALAAAAKQRLTKVRRGGPNY